MLCCNIGMGELAWNCLIVVFRVTRRCYYVGKSSMTFKREGILNSKIEIENFRKVGILIPVLLLLTTTKPWAAKEMDKDRD
ncbi:hypothetical protein HZH66_010135 [Vespula vulgaris]|uniref:Uncharacterized protein n=1 Tax=Vespula vulgaris TaxID=7454 RepID=A0A834MZV4_VESVU|nr:hypothetical protein HZH66_010135 [Vespula vulgaris]